MTRILFTVAFLLGAAVVVWMAAGFVGSDVLALTVTLIIGAVYSIGFIEQTQFRKETLGLARALDQVKSPITALDSWLNQLPANLQNAVRLRIEGERRMEKEVDDKKLHRVERFYGHFARQFTVPEDADTSQIKAHSRDGTLQVHLPRISKPESDKRQVEIH